MAAQVGAHGRRVMEAIEGGRRFRRDGAGWRAGALAVPDSLILELKRHDLVKEGPEGLALTRAGQGWNARAARPDLPNRLMAERAAPQDGEERTGTPRRRPRSVAVNLVESPLGWLMARGMVTPRQFDAGERLRGDWTMAGLGPSVTMRWDAAPASRTARGPGSTMDPTLAQISAKRRFEAALEAAGGGLRDVLWRVICAGEGLEAAERALRWPKRAGKLVMLMALDRVADFYGIR
jgi:hypothetical protein